METPSACALAPDADHGVSAEDIAARVADAVPAPLDQDVRCEGSVWQRDGCVAQQRAACLNLSSNDIMTRFVEPDRFEQLFSDIVVELDTPHGI